MIKHVTRVGFLWMGLTSKKMLASKVFRKELSGSIRIIYLFFIDVFNE